MCRKGKSVKEKTKHFHVIRRGWTWPYCVGPCCHLHREWKFSSHYSTKIQRLLRVSLIPVGLVTLSAWPPDPHLCSGTSQPPKKVTKNKTNKNTLAYLWKGHVKPLPRARLFGFTFLCMAHLHYVRKSTHWWGAWSHPKISWSQQTNKRTQKPLFGKSKCNDSVP